MPADAPRPTTVARVITRLNIGGPSIQATRLTTLLEPHGFQTRLLHGRLGDGEGDMSYLLAPGADARFIATLCRPLSPLNDLRTVFRLYREFRELKPAIVHTHMAKAGMVGRVAAFVYNLTRGTAPRARIIHTYHGHVLEGYFSPLMTTVFIGLERVLARISDAIIAISPAIEAQLRDQFRIGRAGQYRVVPLGFDLAPFAAIDDAARIRARRELDLPDEAEVVCTVGRLTAIKQHRLFLETIARAAEARPRLLALIAGDGELRAELEQYARGLGIAGRVRFLGWRRDLATIYGASDVFLLTSRNEGTPVALIEAMASAIPGVSTDVGGVKDVILSDDVGTRVGEHRAEPLAAGVVALLGDDRRRRDTGAAARLFALQHFGIDRLVSDIVKVYEEFAPRQ